MRAQHDRLQYVYIAAQLVSDSMSTYIFDASRSTDHWPRCTIAKFGDRTSTSRKISGLLTVGPIGTHKLIVGPPPLRLAWCALIRYGEGDFGLGVLIGQFVEHRCPMSVIWLGTIVDQTKN